MNLEKFYAPNYIILPKNVYLNKNLNTSEIKLYGIVSAFSNNNKNACFLKNKSLSKILNVNIRQTQKCLANLKNNNLINIIYENNRRYIRTFMDESLYDNMVKPTIELVNYDWLNDQDE